MQQPSQAMMAQPPQPGHPQPPQRPLGPPQQQQPPISGAPQPPRPLGPPIPINQQMGAMNLGPPKPGIMNRPPSLSNAQPLSPRPPPMGSGPPPSQPPQQLNGNGIHPSQIMNGGVPPLQPPRPLGPPGTQAGSPSPRPLRPPQPSMTLPQPASAPGGPPVMSTGMRPPTPLTSQSQPQRPPMPPGGGLDQRSMASSPMSSMPSPLSPGNNQTSAMSSTGVHPQMSGDMHHKMTTAGSMSGGMPPPMSNAGNVPSMPGGTTSSMPNAGSMAPMSKAENVPPMSAGMAPPMVNSGNMPPMSSGISNTGTMPPMSSGMAQPMSVSGSMPPLSTGMAPPMSNSGIMPPMSGGMAPPMSNSGSMPPMSTGMAPQMSSAGGMPPMPTGMAPQMSSAGSIPPMPGGMAPQMSSAGNMPPMSGGMAPPMSNSGSMPPMSAGMAPPMSSAGNMPPTPSGMSNAATMHPMSSGMAPPMSNSTMPGSMPGGMQSTTPRPGMPPVMGPQRPGMPLPPMGCQPRMPCPPGPPGGPPFPPQQQPPQPHPQQPPQQQYPGQQQYASQAGGGGGRRTLDPDQMPSPITVMEEDSKNRGGYFETREKGAIPPLVTTKFIARDYGNASPRFIRSTLYHVPATPDLMKQAGVPFGLVITPLAPVAEGEIEPQVTDFGPSGPVRCIRCKAYMCSYMQFVDGGRRFQCVFCKATTEVPQDYFQHLDHNGMRLDHYQRPELCLGVYEVLATKDYCRDSKEPTVPGVIFAIDVSYPMMKEGVVSLLCQNMKDLLKSLPRDMNCDKDKLLRVGFMTYDNKINFYNINGILSQPQQMTVGDVGDMFVPLVDGFLTDISESEAVIDSLMEQIPQMFAETRETETILGPVIQAGKEAFKAANCAGKLVVFHHNLPVADAPGKLKNRDDRKVLNTDKEKSVLMPQTKFYNELGKECVSVGCSVDLFLFNNAYIDVATVSQVCRMTGGQLYKYTYFQKEIDGDRFLRDLHHNLSRPIVFDAIMRVRTSTGVRPVDFFGSFYMANSTDTELASLNSDMAITCEVKHDDKLTEEDGVYIQVALLFTSCSGQRRLRIINLSLNTGTNLADMYRSCELDTIVNFTAKQSINKLMESNPKTVKEYLINSCAQILACYRKNCASPSSAGQLILPECMKLLPLYTNCMIKSDVLAGGPDVGCDERAFLMNSVSSMDVASTVSFFYPSLIPIHDVNVDEVHVPGIIRCSIEKVRDDGVYLLENGLYLFMYIGLAADPAWIRDVFGVQTAAQIDVEKPRLDTDEERSKNESKLYKRVIGIIDNIRARRPRYMRLVLVRQRDKLDVLFRHYLCEDRTGNDGNFSYVDFLCHMHKEIRALLG